MGNVNGKIMELVNVRTGLMRCKVCGATHTANIRPRSKGAFQKGSWNCVNGCKLPEKKKQ